MARDCEAVDKELSTRLCGMDEYLRLNVERGMEYMAMNEWDDLGAIETHTSAYVECPAISDALDASLKRLQGGTGTTTLGQISKYLHISSARLSTFCLPMAPDHPRTAKDVRDQREKQREVMEVAIESVRGSGEW
jgi:hypothetical protein